MCGRKLAESQCVSALYLAWLCLASAANVKPGSQSAAVWLMAYEARAWRNEEAIGSADSSLWLWLMKETAAAKMISGNKY